MHAPEPSRVALFGAVGGLVILGTGVVALATASPGSLTPWIVALAGLADGFNPCSFAGLLVFASVTTAAFERNALACHDTDPSSAPAPRRARVVLNGSVYIAGLFVTYMALGLGLLTFMNILTEGHWIGRSAAILSIGMGLWVLRDGLFPESRWKLEMPRIFRPRIRRALQATLIPAVFAAGVLVGLCTVPCTGGVYLGVLGLLSSEAAAGLGLLVLYNMMFILPLVVVLTVVTSRPAYRSVARWHIRTKNVVKLTLGVVMIALGFLTLLVLT